MSIPAEEMMAALEAFEDDAEGADLGTEAEANYRGDKREPIDDDQLLSIIEEEINRASTGWTSGLSDDREDAMDYYLGRPRGDEREGQSSVISMDVADVLEWILPQAVRAFTMNEALIQFDAVGEGDEEQAEMESAYVHHVFNKQDDTYEFLYSFIKDALLSKNGVAKTWWCIDNRRTTETYEDLTDEEFAMLVDEEQDDQSTVEPLEHTEYQQSFPTAIAAPELIAEAEQKRMQIMQEIQAAQQQGAPGNVLQAMQAQADAILEQTAPPEEIPVTLHALKVRRTRSRGLVKIKCIAPEKFGVSTDTDSLNLEHCRFSYHWEDVMASDLVEEGFSVDFVDDLPDSNDQDDEGRDIYDDGNESHDSIDMSTRRIRVFECYIRLDRDGDGIAEMLKVRAAGPDSYSLIDVEEVDGNPFSSITPFILTHKFGGLSIYDKIKQIQDQKTILWRQILDNLYQQNNRRTIIIDGQVNIDDLLTSRPNGVVRALSPDAVMPFPVDPIGQDGYTMLEYLDKVRTERTGTSPEGTSQAFPVGADTAHGLERLMTMKEELVGLIIRTMAETGFKRIALQIRDLLMKHQNKAEQVKLAGTWTTIDPSEWRHRYNTTVNVVLGVGDKIRRQASAGEILNRQRELVEGGGLNRLVTEDRIFNALRDWVRFGELGTADDYFLDPASDEAKQLIQEMENKPQEPGDLEKAAMVTADAEMRMADMKRDSEFKREQLKARIEVLKQQLQQAKDQNATAKELTQFYEELTYKYDELEATQKTDIPGKGTSG